MNTQSRYYRGAGATDGLPANAVTSETLKGDPAVQQKSKRRKKKNKRRRAVMAKRLKARAAAHKF